MGFDVEGKKQFRTERACHPPGAWWRRIGYSFRPDRRIRINRSGGCGRLCRSLRSTRSEPL